MTQLINEKCEPCRTGAPRLSDEEIASMHGDIPDWDVVEHEGVERLEREYTFKDFAEALAFTNRVGQIAEEQSHHPSILTEWGKVKVSWWTHKIRGLHRNDFIMAAKTDEVYGA